MKRGAGLSVRAVARRAEAVDACRLAPCLAAPEEQAANDPFLPCGSRARAPRLVLGL